MHYVWISKAKKPHTEDTYYMIQFISNSRKGKTD